jgi:hypothetical protein
LANRGLQRAGGKRLFTKHVFPGIQGADNHVSMLAIGCSDMDNFYIGIREDLFIAEMRFW